MFLLPPDDWITVVSYDICNILFCLLLLYLTQSIQNHCLRLMIQQEYWQQAGERCIQRRPYCY